MSTRPSHWFRCGLLAAALAGFAAVFPAAALVLLAPLAVDGVGLSGVVLAIAVVIVLVVAATVVSRRRTLAP